MAKKLNELRNAVITVGEGRGFIVSAPSDPWARRYVITGAHCLPNLPPPFTRSRIEDRTYENLLGMLGETPHIWTECIFVDPVSDFAVLAGPDDQVLYDEHGAYLELIETGAAFQAGTPPAEKFSGYVLTLNNEWRQCRLSFNGSLCVENEGSPEIQDGMSGSPILDEAGRAIGVIAIGSFESGKSIDAEGQPCLFEDLPTRLARLFGINNSAA